MRNTLYVVICLFFIIPLIAQTKQEQEELYLHSVLKTVHSRYLDDSPSNNVHKTFFHYDSIGSLNKIDEYLLKDDQLSSLENIILHRDKHQNIITITGSKIPLNDTVECTYENDLLIETIFQHNRYSNTFQYNDNKQIVSKKYQKKESTLPVRTTLYTYNTSGNILTIKDEYKLTKFTYDNKKHPFCQSQNYFSFISEVSITELFITNYKQCNNIIKVETSYYTYEIEYIYNEYNLPINAEVYYTLIDPDKINIRELITSYQLEYKHLYQFGK